MQAAVVAAIAAATEGTRVAIGTAGVARLMAACARASLRAAPHVTNYCMVIVGRHWTIPARLDVDHGGGSAVNAIRRALKACYLCWCRLDWPACRARDANLLRKHFRCICKRFVDLVRTWVAAEAL